MKKLKIITIGTLICSMAVALPLAIFAKDKDKGGPVISGLKAPVVLNVGQTGTWTVNAFDPQNSPLAYAVEWGDVNMHSQTKSPIAGPIFVQTSTFTHAYAAPGAYTVTFTVMDDRGLSTKTTVTIHIVGTAAVLPVISDLVATSSNPHKGKVTWKTDVKSTSLVWYSLTSPVDTTGLPNVTKTSKTTNHSVSLNGLNPDTTYYVVVGSADSAGMTKSDETSFMTPAIVDKNAPTIDSIVASTTVAVGDTVTVTLNASDPHNGALTYSVDWGDMMNKHAMKSLAAVGPIFVQTSTFTHIYNATGTYVATFTVHNDAGLTATKTLTITVTAPVTIVDTTAPVISGTAATSTGTTTETVSWMTDEPSTSALYYSLTSPIDPTSSSTLSVMDSSLLTSHLLNLTDLATSTLYNFIVVSADASGNTATSAPATFTTESGM